MNKSTLLSTFAAAAILGDKKPRRTTTKSRFNTTSASYKLSKIAGMQSKAHQFPDTEKLPNGKHRWFKQDGVLVQRDA